MLLVHPAPDRALKHVLVVPVTLEAKAGPLAQQTPVTFAMVVLVLLQGAMPAVESTVMENLEGNRPDEVVQRTERLEPDATAWKYKRQTCSKTSGK